MTYRFQNARAEYAKVDERSPKNPALAANMKRLMAGRSIEVLRKQMAERGLKIGGGTIHRAVKGEIGNRLESLDKLAAFFDTTTDQLLQFDGPGATYWPFSAELHHAIVILSEEELSKAENVLRAHLGMPALHAGTPIQVLEHSVGDVQQGHTSDAHFSPASGYASSAVKRGSAQRRYSNLEEAARYAGDGSNDGAQDQRAPHRKGGGRN